MKGWVYIISNKAMPELIKVGYSMQDPAIRAEELNHTGSPHPYIVDYAMVIEEPYQVEQKVHEALSPYSEGKEWFHCSIEEAIITIQKFAGDRVIGEVFNTKSEKLMDVKGKFKDIQAIFDDMIRSLRSLEFYLSSKEEKKNTEIIENKIENLRSLARAAEQQILQILVMAQRSSEWGK
jgi:hypothetical protein